MSESKITKEQAAKGVEITLSSSTVMASFKGTSLEGVQSVPIGNTQAYKDLVGNTEVYEFINTVKLGPDFQAQLDPWTNIELTEEWAQSYAKGINEVPAPLYIRGHENSGTHYKMRAVGQGYVVGARVKGNELHLRNTIPIVGTDEDIELAHKTAREIKANMLSTSSADLIVMQLEIDEDKETSLYKAVESVGQRSNALVEFDQTGSYAQITDTSFKNGSSYEEPKNNIQGASEMDKMTLEQMFVSMKNQLETGALSLTDAAKNLGITILTQADKLALKRLTDVETAMGVPVDVFYKKQCDAQEATFKSLKEAAISKKFVSDELIETATELFTLKAGTVEEITAEVERVAAFKVFKTLRGNEAGKVGASFNADGVQVNGDDNETVTTMEG